MMKLIQALVLSIMMIGGVANATPIIQSNSTTISNWQFSWGEDVFSSGLGWIWDMDGNIQTPLQVKFNGLNPLDPYGSVASWITPHIYDGGYTFTGIDLLEIVGEIAYTNIGKGEAYYLPDSNGNQVVAGFTFQGVTLDLTPVSSVPEPTSLFLLTAGLLGLVLVGKRKNLISRQC